ncbi:hypothetical protein GCM10011613_28250 [Cellvibrio zantedeschiae]|uniref:SnoaL-like domain-containing protein n=1 Tax=Cellvibrio zantedeschiae TaxID=1237077 RepID=A0ABQ3B7G1_9GAMM|nr:nuclear transport factor 2 family protein [Cellvibrio zantedeschiae]GGY81903.1 hypothetical protein GCM10011613_28250 [Cellvibrio zantedeschiae]
MMKFVIRLCIAGLIACVFMANAQTPAQTQSPKLETAVIELQLKNYSEAWVTTDPVARRTKLQKIWVQDATHESPFGLSDGLEAINKEIDGFVKTYPNVKIQLTTLHRTGNHVLCNFVVNKPDGSLLFKGADYFEFNEQGLLKKAVGFVQQGA